MVASNTAIFRSAAAARARADRLPGLCGVAAADGRALPYGDKCFDAITHSDVLCCLPGKQAVLAECRRTLADGGKTADVILFSAFLRWRSAP